MCKRCMAPAALSYEPTPKGAAPQVDILIVVCSCFAPTPSLASMIVNHFKMRTDVLSHNLAGMGCSGGVVALDMAKQFLQARARAPGCNTSAVGAGLETGPWQSAWRTAERCRQMFSEYE